MVEHCVYCGEETEYGGYHAKGEIYCDEDCYNTYNPKAEMTPNAARIKFMDELQTLCESFGVNILGTICFASSNSEYVRYYKDVLIYPGAMFSKIDGEPLCNSGFTKEGIPEWEIRKALLD